MEANRQTVNQRARWKPPFKSATLLSGAALLILLIVTVVRPRIASNEPGHFAGEPLRNQTETSAPHLPPPAIETSTSEASERPFSEDEDAQMAAWISASPLKRAWYISSEGMAPYETILSAIDLRPNQMRRLKQLIVERLEGAKDADELGKEYNAHADETSAVRKGAESIIDQEIARLVGDSNFQTIREMLELTPQLQELAHFVVPALKERDLALNADQTLRLAQIYQHAYAGEPNTPPVDRSAGIDPQTGLGEADRELLAAAASILNPEQLDVTRSRLSKLPLNHL